MMPVQTKEVRLVSFKYEETDLEARKIALTFRKVSLADPSLPSYVALSYVWGDTQDSVGVSISDDIIPATPNLFTILQCLASSHDTNLFWIDALCINQQDLDERAAQVAQMGEVYAKASYVLAFLSPVFEPFELGLEFMQTAAENPEMHYEPSLTPHIEAQGAGLHSNMLRDSLIGFFAAPWWTRVWTVQEFALATKVIFQCGQHRVDTEIIQKALWNLRAHEATCCGATGRTTYGSRGFLDYPSQIHGDLSIYRAMLRMNNLHVVLNGQDYGIYDLLGAMGLFRIRDCADPRDRIFGLLGLKLSQSHQGLVEPNYSVATAGIYQDLTVRLIHASQSLDVLSHVVYGSFIKSQTPDLPGWVPDWDSTFDIDHHMINQERLQFIDRYSASGGTAAVWMCNDTRSARAQVLWSDEVAHVAPGYPRTSLEAGGRDLLGTWRELAGLSRERSSHVQINHDSKEASFYLTLCGKLGTGDWNTNPESHIQAYLAWEQWFIDSCATSPNIEANNARREYDNLVRITGMGRRFFVTVKSLIGFGPDSMDSGDTVAVLSGGKVPYVLRKALRSESQEVTETCHEFLGDAYLEGVMHGEKVRPGLLKAEMISII